MTRPNAAVVVTVIALVIAGIASWKVYSYLQKETRKAKTSPMEKAVVAVVNLPVGAKINATHVKVVDWPRESKIPGAFGDVTAVINRVVVRTIIAGDLITEQKLLPKDVRAGAGMMTYAVPDGHRAVTVGVNEVAGVAGFLSPGNQVDLVLTTQIPGKNSGENISKIILQSVPVLATGQITTEQKDGKPVVVPTVTLDLTPENAEKLVLASSKGSLQLLLRSVMDNAHVVSRGATITKVLTGDNGSLPVQGQSRIKTARIKAMKPVQESQSITAPYTVEIIRGTTKTSRQFTLDH
jgi:pilus assembly protein CpaB